MSNRWSIRALALFSSIRSLPARTTPALVFATVSLSILLDLTAGCSGPKIAPPPPMGDLSGAWLFQTEGRPIRFVNGRGDTLSLTISQEPVMLRQGHAASDSSIVIEMFGLLVSGATQIPRSFDDRSTAAELVTAGPSAGTLTFRAPALSFLGKWNGREFSGHFQVDKERAGRDVKALDPQRAWSLRRIERGGGISN